MYMLETCFTSHKNICKIVNQKIAQKIHYIYTTTISFYDIAPFRTKICLKFFNRVLYLEISNSVIRIVT